jgi:hypothetical protein
MVLEADSARSGRPCSFIVTPHGKRRELYIEKDRSRDADRRGHKKYLERWWLLSKISER